MSRPILVVVGGQYGSEGKGAVASALGKAFNANWAVRTGAVNAGHTVYHQGKRFVMQQLPVGWTNPRTGLALGPGAMINPAILQREVDELEAAGMRVRDRLWIDIRAGLHTDEHQARAKEAGRHHLIGATGKGCSEALIAKIRDRGRGAQLFADIPQAKHYRLADTTRILNDAYDAGGQILLEGTQGSLLDLHLGPYPFTTHKQTQAAQWVSEAGLSPALDYRVVLVVRTYPIRVAGNSGPMPNEISWPELARRINRQLAREGRGELVLSEALDGFERACAEIGTAWATGDRLPWDGSQPDYNFHAWPPEQREAYKVAVSEFHKAVLDSLPPATVQELCKLFEMTTVTKKLRRIAELNLDAVRQAVRWNRPWGIAFTFANYLRPEIWGQTAWEGAMKALGSEEARSLFRRMIRTCEDHWGAPIRWISTGPEDDNLMAVDRQWVEAGREALPDDHC